MQLSRLNSHLRISKTFPWILLCLVMGAVIQQGAGLSVCTDVIYLLTVWNVLESSHRTVRGRVLGFG